MFYLTFKVAQILFSFITTHTSNFRNTWKRNRKRVTEGVWINEVVIERHSISTHIRRESTSWVLRSRNCISCVPRCLFHVHQLRPELLTPNVMSCVPQLVRNCIGCIERCGYTKCPTIGRFLHSFIVLYFIHNYTHTYRSVEWYRQHSCFIMLLSNV